jgi:hypothetical protein
MFNFNIYILKKKNLKKSIKYNFSTNINTGDEMEEQKL